MRDKRRRGPGSPEPDNSSGADEWLDERWQPWATPAANDNGVRDDLADLANDFSDEPTTLYNSATRRQNVAKPARRPSARYRPPQPTAASRAPTQAQAQAKDELRFGIEGSLPRSLRPGRPPQRSRNYTVVLAGLLGVGLAALWASRGPAWSRAMMSVATHGAGIANSRSSLGRGHLVEPTPAPAEAAPAPPAEAAPGPMEQTAEPTTDDARPAQDDVNVMEFDLADVPADDQDQPAVHGKRHRRWRMRRAQRAAARRRAKSAARPIQPLREADEETYHEPVYYRAAVNEGTLQVNSRPWARVLVDGHFMGHTPQRALRLPAGRHHVQLVNEQLDMSKFFDVVIAPGQVVTRVELLDEDAHSSR